MSTRRRTDGAHVITRLGWWVIGVGIALAQVGFLRGDVWLYLVALLALAAVAVSWVLAPRLPHLPSTLLVPPVEIVGRPTTARLRLVAAATPTPRHHLTVLVGGDERPLEIVVDALAAGETHDIDLALNPSARGVHERMVLQRWTASPFDLVRRVRHDVSAVVRTVSAGVDDARVAPMPRHGEGDGGAVRVGRSGPDVHALRPWSPGDGTAIHWRATMRRGEPVVVDRESNERTSLAVVVGPAAGAEETDTVVARAAGIALRASREGAEVLIVSSLGVERVTAAAAEELLAWTVLAAPVAGVAENAELTMSFVGAGGRVALVRGAAPAEEVWAQAAARHGIDVVEVVVTRAPSAAAPDAADPTPAPPRALAWATLASLAGGLLALTATGVLTTAMALAWAAAISAAGGFGLMRAATFSDPRVRTAVALLLVALTGVLAFGFANDGSLPLAAATAVCGVTTVQLVSARSRRDSLVAMGLGPVMIVAAAGFAPGPGIVLPTVLTTIAAMVALSVAAESILTDGVTTTTSSATASSATARTRVAPVAAVVAIGVVAFLVLPLGAAPTHAGSLLGGGDAGGNPDPPTRAEQAANFTQDYLASSLDLSARGHLTDNPAYAVPVGTEGLWRATTLERVTGGSWGNDMLQGSFRSGADGLVLLPADPADAGAPRRTARDYRVRPISRAAILAPGPAQSVSSADTVEQWGATSFILTNGGLEYSVRAVPREDVDQLASVGTGPDRRESLYVELDTVTARERELSGTLVASSVDRVAAVRAVESWLRTNVRYQLDAPLPPEGQDPVDFLLFDSRAGFCEHFAAAEVTLLRLAGIPSRIATGYSVSAAHEDTPGWLTARESDAHAWVEVWIPGHGWVSSDPTAASALADPASSQSLLDRAGSAWTSLWASDSSRRLLAAVILLVAAITTGVVLGLRGRSGSGGRRRQQTRLPALEPLAAFGRFRTALASDGTGQGPGDGIAHVRRDVAGDAALLAALDVVERTLYDRALPPAMDRVAAADLLDRRTAELVAGRTPATIR